MDSIVVSTPLPPPNSYVEALTLNVIVFGDGAFKEIIKVGHLNHAVCYILFFRFSLDTKHGFKFWNLNWKIRHECHFSYWNEMLKK